MKSNEAAVATNPPLVFVNIGWMNHYKGPRNDRTLGGHGYLKTHDYGYEAWNFQPVGGLLYGYVPRSAQVRLQRLGGSSKDISVAGVTVVWIARNPRDGKTYVVGWYKSATVHKSNDHHSIKRSKNDLVDYQIEAPAAKAHLLPIERRVLRVPTEKLPGNLGQSPVWYGNPDFLKLVQEFLGSGGYPDNVKNKKSTSVPRQVDPLLRRKIEEAAVKNAIAFYSSSAGGKYLVRSVETDRVGWDLEAESGDVKLLIEVKGLSGAELCVELTPHEYEKMMSTQHRSAYVVYVVTEATTAREKRHIFYYDSELSSRDSHLWTTEDGRLLNVLPRTGARLTVK